MISCFWTSCRCAYSRSRRCSESGSLAETVVRGSSRRADRGLGRVVLPASCVLAGRATASIRGSLVDPLAECWSCWTACWPAAGRAWSREGWLAGWPSGNGSGIVAPPFAGSRVDIDESLGRDFFGNLHPANDVSP